MFHCELCDGTFTRKCNLKRHIVSKHSIISTLFECPECDRHFLRKDHLKQHAVTHVSDPFIFDCAHCSKKLKSRRTLIKHLTVVHRFDHRIFECEHCSKKLKSRRTLIKHLAVVHRLDRRIFKCEHCSKKFKSKQTLIRHLAEVHRPDLGESLPDANNEYNRDQRIFECFHCSFIFNRKERLRRHIDRCQSVQKESRFACLKCSKIFRYSKVLKRHYVQVHGVVLTYKTLKFDNVKNFEQWLENEQHQTITQFVIWDTKKFAFHSFRRYMCHRSKNRCSKLNMGERKRCLKTNGYKYLGGMCPAEIRIKIQNHGTCFVMYQKTHIGHNTGDESELGLIYTSKAEKIKIAAKIQSGIPLAQIVDRERLQEFSDKNISRLSLLNHQDVRNIAASKHLDFESGTQVEQGCNSIDAEEKIAEHADDILFYKRQAEEDMRFNVLQKDDFLLVIMTANQQTYLRTYGHKVVCLDSIHDTNTYGFILHTLLVLGTDCEGLPVAFLLTNRNDQCVIDIFLTCIRDRVGIVESKTLISDMQIMYYNSWIKIMAFPQFYLYCSWHVREEWRRNYGKIPDKKKRKDTQKELISLSHELDPIQFENGLNSFLSREDEDLKKFQDYFSQNYGSRVQVQRWAYCYGKIAGINMNMNLESFYKAFKYNLAGGLKIRSLTQYLVFIFDYLALQETNILEKKVRGKITNKLSILRSRHRSALAQYKKDALSKVIAINSDTFLIQSFEKCDTFYTVSKCELKECVLENTACRLVCDWCNSCFHTFNCTCEDSSIKSNMCKHIHLIGLYLRDQLSELDVDRLQCISDEKYFNDNVANDENTRSMNDENTKSSNNREEFFKKNFDVENDNILGNDNDICKQKYHEVIVKEMQILLNSCHTEEKLKYVCDKILAMKQTIRDEPATLNCTLQGNAEVKENF